MCIRDRFYSNVIDLNVGKTKIEVILKDLQRDPQKSNITHIDFLVVDQNVKITVNVPIKYVNEETCVGVKTSGGVISHIITDVEISCFPKDIPENIEVDIQELDINQSIHLTEISLPDGVEFVSAADKDHDSAIVKCYQPVEEVIETEAPEAVDEPEDAKASKDDDAPEDTSPEEKADAPKED